MALVLDTHAVIWYLSGSKQLSRIASGIIETAERNGDDVFVSAISLVESFTWRKKADCPPWRCKDCRMLLKIPPAA